jgi:hypothetical protein
MSEQECHQERLAQPTPNSLTAMAGTLNSSIARLMASSAVLA